MSEPDRGGERPGFAPIEAAIDDIRQGRMILVVDDEDRENEGDLVMAADRVTPEAINFMAKHGRGLICVPMTGERLDELRISMMVTDNTAPMGTAFTVTVDAKRGVTTGTSAYDRALTVRALVDPATRPEDLARPGHILPLRSMSGGVLRRAGHTEAAVDLARFAGLLAGRRHLRGDGRAGGDGAPPGALRAGRAVRPPDDHHQGPDPVPHPEGQAGPAGGDHAPADGLRVLRGDRVRDHGGRPRGPGADDGGDPRGRSRPRADALGVPDRGRVPLPALRLRGPAREGAHDHRRRGPRRASSTSARRAAASAS